MAKVTGPLFSLGASGAYGGALVFGARKGVNVVRKLVIPANPNSQGQEDARNIVRIGGALQRWVNATTTKLTGETQTDKVRLTAAAPSNNTWNGHLVKIITGAGALTFAAAQASYATLDAAQKTAWNTAAMALSPALGSVVQTEEGGGTITPFTAGEAFFVYIYGLASVGMATSPGAVPPVYA